MFLSQFMRWLIRWPWRKSTGIGIDFIRLVINSSQPCNGRKKVSVWKKSLHQGFNSALFMLVVLYPEFSFTKTMLSFMRSGVCQSRDASICQRFNPTPTGKSKWSFSKHFWSMLQYLKPEISVCSSPCLFIKGYLKNSHLLLSIMKEIQ